MDEQINLKLSKELLEKARFYAEHNGYSDVQDLINEALREKLYDTSVTEEEMALIKRVVEVADKRNDWVSEKELFDVMKSKSRCTR